MMFQRILVPLDGSPQSERALPVAVRLAQATGGTLVIVRAVAAHEELAPFPVPSLPSATIQTILEIRRTEASHYLRTLALSEALHDVPTRQEVPDGPAAFAILSLAQTHQCNLIVLCRHGHRGITRWALGGVAEKVVYDANIPVLILHDQDGLAGASPHQAGQSLRAGIPLDGSPQAEKALLPAAHLVASLSDPGTGEVRLIQVVNLPDGNGRDGHQQESGERDYLIREAQRYLSALASRFSREIGTALNIAITWSFVPGTSVAEALLDATEPRGEAAGGGRRGSYDLLALSTHGRAGMQRHMIGSVAERLLHTSHLPLLLVPSRDVRYRLVEADR